MFVVLVCGAPVCRGAEAVDEDAVEGQAPVRVLPAEFEPHDAVLLTWHAEDLEVQSSLARLIAAAWESTRFVMLVEDARQREQATEVLANAGVPPAAVHFLRANCDTIWTRDFGPLMVRTGRDQYEMVDADYDRGDRPNDDRVPLAVSEQLVVPAVHLPLTVEGGNLLSNGGGLCLATSKLLQDNLDRGYAEAQVRELLRIGFGAEVTVFLEPLAGEPTGHVDMFATFVAEDTVLVAAYSDDDDPINAAVLDHNADLLSHVVTRRGRLRVVRIPMPARGEGDHWRTYTNVLFANRQVLVPVYAESDRRDRARTLSTYRRLLPGWKVTPVDCTSLIELGGALHCVSMPLAQVRVPLGNLPPEPWDDDADIPPANLQRWRAVAEGLRPPSSAADDRLAGRFRRVEADDIFGDSPSAMFGGAESEFWPRRPRFSDARPRSVGGRPAPFPQSR